MVCELFTREFRRDALGHGLFSGTMISTFALPGRLSSQPPNGSFRDTRGAYYQYSVVVQPAGRIVSSWPIAGTREPRLSASRPHIGPAGGLGSVNAGAGMGRVTRTPSDPPHLRWQGH